MTSTILPVYSYVFLPISILPLLRTATERRTRSSLQGGEVKVPLVDQVPSRLLYFLFLNPPVFLHFRLRSCTDIVKKKD